MIVPDRRKESQHRSTQSVSFPSRTGLRVLLILFMPLALLQGVVGMLQPPALASGNVSPDVGPPSNLAIVTLDSSFHVTWTPSTDPLAAWHVVSVWDGSTLQQSKVVGRTARAAQTNGLMTGHTYTVRVQAMDAQGNLSTAISATQATDPQSPMRNAAFFENFNGPAGNLDPNYFDVRTSHGADLHPESLGLERMLVFNNENHFHTQIVSGKQRAEIYLRPRVPFDFAGRTGTFQFEVDMSPTQHSQGKWFEMHLVRNIPWSAEEFGAGRGDDFPDSIEFSVRATREPETENNVNIPMITVNIGGNPVTFEGTARQMSPANVRLPMVLKVSQTSAEFYINGVRVVNATGFTLPFTRGYWMAAHRGWYAPRDLRTTPVIVQLIHWETMQFDGPAGSYNPVVRTYIQPNCPGMVRNEHDEIVGCPTLDFTPGHRSNTVTLNIPENVAQARSAKLLFNGNSSTGSLNLSVNGNNVTVPVRTCCYLNTLSTYDLPASYLRTGNNSLVFSYTGNDSASISQVELEVVYDQQRVMQNPSMSPMSMLAVSTTSYRVDHVSGDPTVHTMTTYLSSLGSSTPVNYMASVVTSDTPWLTVSPATGVVSSAALGGGVVPLTLSVNFSGLTTDGDGRVGVVKITGGNMPLYVGVLAVNDGSQSRPPFIQSFTNLASVFDKSAIPDYHGTGGTPTPAGSPLPTWTRTPTPPPGSPVPTNTPVSTSTPVDTPTPVPTVCGITYTDVPADHWAFAYINYLACNNIISGYSDGTFRPGNNTTRGQTAKIVVLAQGWPINTSGGPHFSDVPESNPFYGYIETAYNQGVISGYSDGTFRWGNNVTRGQLSKIVVLAQGWPINTSGGPHFSDVPESNPFYGYIETAYNYAIITGYADGTFRPGNNTTRAQLSKIVYLAITGP